MSTFLKGRILWNIHAHQSLGMGERVSLIKLVVRVIIHQNHRILGNLMSVKLLPGMKTLKLQKKEEIDYASSIATRELGGMPPRNLSQMVLSAAF